MTVQADLEAYAALCASLDGVAEAVRDDMADRRQRHAAEAVSLWPVEAPVIPFSAVPTHGQLVNYGPNTGYCWVIQRISVFGFGATTDFINVFRAHGNYDALGQNFLQSFNVPVVGMGSTWHPGGHGLILMPEETLALTGTFTGTTGFLSSDAHQLELRELVRYLR